MSFFLKKAGTVCPLFNLKGQMLIIFCYTSYQLNIHEGFDKMKMKFYSFYNDYDQALKPEDKV